MKCGLTEGEALFKVLLEYTVFPSLDEHSDLSAPSFKHGLYNTEALAGTVKEGKILGRIYRSLYLNLFDLLSQGKHSQDSI